MDETWRDVVGYESLLSVSSHGRVYSKRTNRILKQFLTSSGYYNIATKIGGRLGISKSFRIHRLVAEAFSTLRLSKLLVSLRKHSIRRLL